MARKNHKNSDAARAQSSPVTTVRAINSLLRLLLFVRAGGRCEFDGCNEYLLEHPLTLKEGNFAEVAHVVAFKPDGPRGKDGPRPADINDVGNLMLLCPVCHKLIDTHPNDYSRQTLEEYKERHEYRIKHVTGLGPEQKTSLLILKTVIGKQIVTLPYDHILEAIAPRYPISRQGTIIDLTQISGEGSAFLEAARRTIEQKVARLLDPGGEVSQSGHISLFALAPIPLLILLGSQISNKIPLDVYQRHRDKENWTWKKSGKPIEYVFRSVRAGSDRSRVALVISLSGAIPEKSLPREIDASFFVYEVTLKSISPVPTFLRTRRDLENFRTTYQSVLATIIRDHGILKDLYLFPAVPAPIAVLCGRELLPKVHPSLRVYDYDKAAGGFIYQLKVNEL